MDVIDLEAVKETLTRELSPVYPTVPQIKALNWMLTKALGKEYRKLRIRVVDVLVGEAVVQIWKPTIDTFTSTKQIPAPMVSSMIQFLKKNPDDPEDWTLDPKAETLIRSIAQTIAEDETECT